MMQFSHKVNLFFILFSMEKRFFADKKYIWLFPVAIITGTVFTNFAGYDNVKQWGIFTEDFIARFLSVNASFADVLKYVLKERIKLFLIMFLMSLTPIRAKLSYLVCGYAGFCVGMILSSLTMQYGARYLLLFFLAILCHMILYAVAIYGIFVISWNGKDAKTLLQYGVITAVFAAGILVETLMNYYVLPKVLIKW